MPITATLSREFYERFGDRVVGELIALLNQVDTTYRSELRELNEANFARFDDRLERRFADSDGRWQARWTELDLKWERRLAEMEARWETRTTTLEAGWEKRLTDLEARWETRITALEAGWKGRFADLDARWTARMADLRAELIKWMFLFWLGTVASMLGIGRLLLS